MASRRRDDAPAVRSRFRTDRVMKSDSEWYFLTREGTVEGPFRSKEDAAKHLEVYIRLAVSNMLSEGAELTLVE
jgi:hypothetical protein